MSLERTLLMNQLFAYYGNLLTEKQKEMLSLYYEEDYSLAEIAEHYQISRQGVFDNIKRAEQALENYESQLHLLHLRNRRLELYQQLNQQLQNQPSQQVLAELIKLEYEL